METERSHAITYDDTLESILDDPRFRRAIDPVRAAILMDAETSMIDQQTTARIEAATEAELANATH